MVGGQDAVAAAGVPPLAEEFRARMDAGTGLVGRFLLTPCR